MNYDFKPVLVNNFFNQKEYDAVYNTVNAVLEDKIENSSNHKYKIADVGYIAVTHPFDSIVLDKIRDTAQKYTNIKLKNAMTHFARYTHKSDSKPSLRPHYDIMLESASITISIQLESSLDWSLFVENQELTLANNNAAIFSGSHQIHWRPPMEFGDNDFFDVIVCQLYEDIADLSTPAILTDDHKSLMKDKANSYNLEYDKIYS